MQLKLTKADFKTRPLTVLVKAPRFYCETIHHGATVEVEDQLGYAIMNAYPGAFEQVDGDRVARPSTAPAPAPRADAARVTKPAAPPPRTTMAPDAAAAGGK